MKKNNKIAFTMVEIMVVIALITIFYLWITSLNFWQKSNEQKAEILANKIVSEIESYRNDVLFWKIDTKNTENNTDVNKILEKTLVFSEQKFWNINIIEKEEISYHCDDSNTNLSWNEIKFENNKNSILPWENNVECKIFKITTSVNWEKYEVSFDLVSWLVKKEKIKNNQ